MTDAGRLYGDIISRGHHVSESRPRMSAAGRAVQFAPFAALTGYDDLISESERYTESSPEIDDGMKSELNDRLVFLLRQEQAPQAVFTFFVPDGRKPGGKYVTLNDRLAMFDSNERRLIFAGGRSMPVECLVALECDEFDAEK